jgi:hypothetical protein
MARTAAEIIAAVQPTGPSRPPVVWTQKVARDNLVAMTDDSIVIDTLPRAEIDEAQRRLEGEARLDSVLSPRPLTIRFQAVQAVQARLNSTDVEVAYDSGGKRMVSRRVTMAGAEEQAEFLAQARERLPQGCEVVESCGSRVFHALTPFHVFVLFAMLAAGAHLFYTTEMFVLDDASEQTSPFPAPTQVTWRQHNWESGEWEDLETQPQMQPAFTGRTIVPAFFARSLRRTRIGGLVFLAAAAIAGVLAMVGQAVTMTVLLGGVAGSGFWTFSRFSNPPRTLALVVPQRR